MDPRGFEPLTPCMPCRCATSCATGPCRPEGNSERFCRLEASPRERMAEPITVAITRTVDPDRAAEVGAWARAGQDLLSARSRLPRLGLGALRARQPRVAHALPVRRRREPRRVGELAGACLVGGIRSRPRRATPRERRTGIEGWFDDPPTVEVHGDPPPAPPRWKQMVSIFIVFYPLSLAANFVSRLADRRVAAGLRVLVSCWS